MFSDARSFVHALFRDLSWVEESIEKGTLWFSASTVSQLHCSCCVSIWWRRLRNGTYLSKTSLVVASAVPSSHAVLVSHAIVLGPQLVGGRNGHVVHDA